MRKYLKLLSLALVATLVTACSLDELSTSPGTGSEPIPEDTSSMGYLKLGGVNFTTDSEDTNIDGNPTASATRNQSLTTQEASDDFWIEIYGGPRHSATSPFKAFSGTYATVKSKPNGIPLEPGDYTVYAYQTSDKTPSEQISNAPYYAGKETFTIESKQTSVVEVVCRLANVKTSVELSADLKEVFKVYNDPNNAAEYAKRLKTEVTLSAEGKNDISHTFERETTHGEPKYYIDLSEASDAGNTMTIHLTGDYYTGDRVDIINGSPDPSNWKEVKMNKEIRGVKAGQWRKISIGIDYNTTGNVQFVITVESYAYDSEIPVGVATLYSSIAAVTEEEAIPDDDVNDEFAPQVSLEGTTEMTFNISQAIYDADAQGWTKYLKAIVTPHGQSTVEQLYVVYRASTNANLLNKMKEKGFADGKINLFSTLTTGANAYINVAADGTKITLNEGGMDALYKYEGTHTFRVYTKSNDGHLGFGDITINVTSGPALGNGPTIKWMANGSEASSITLAANVDEVVSCVVESDSGLTDLSVKIESPLLDSETLTNLALATEMNIITPATPLMETRLRAFGFLPIEGFDPKNPEHVTNKAKMASLPDNYRVWLVDKDGNPIKDSENKDVKTGNQSPLLNAKNVEFEITAFMSLLEELGTLDGAASVEHKFTIYATDAKGFSEAEFTIVVNEK